MASTPNPLSEQQWRHVWLRICTFLDPLHYANHLPYVRVTVFAIFSILFIVFIHLSNYNDKANSQQAEIDETVVHGHYVCDLRRLRKRDDCIAFSFAERKNLLFELRLAKVLGKKCKIIAYREVRPTDVHRAVAKSDGQIAYFDGRLADYSEQNASASNFEAIVGRHTQQPKIPFMAFDIGPRSIKILSSRLMTLRPCQVIIGMYFHDKREAQHAVKLLFSAMFKLVSVRQIRRVAFTRPPRLILGPDGRNRANDYCGYYRMTFSNLQCFADFDCDRVQPSNGRLGPSYLKRSKV